MEQKEAKLFRPAHKLAGTNMLYEGVQHTIFFIFTKISPLLAVLSCGPSGAARGQRLGLEQLAALAQKLQ